MPHSKTPGGQAASDKFLKRDAQAHGTSAPSAPAPGEQPVASDSYTSSVGIEAGTNQPGEKGDVGKVVGEKGKASEAR